VRFAVYWCEEDAPFDPKDPAFGTTLLARIHLEQSENEPAWAKVSCFLPEGSTTHFFQTIGSQAYIAYQSNAQEEWKCLIKGYLADTPSIQDGMLVYRLVADHLDPKPKRVSFFQTVLSQQDPLWAQDWSQTENCLKQTDSILHIDRCTHAYSLSPLFQGNQQIDLEGRFEKKSFTSGVVPTISELCVNLETQWIQNHRGSFSFGPLIRQKAKGMYIQTLTAKSLQKVWPKKNERLGRSHTFWVTESRLDRKSPGLLFQSLQSEPHPIKRSSRSYARLHKTWLDPVLDIAWDIRQKRIESLSFVLKNTLQKKPQDSERKQITWSLLPIQQKPEAKPWLSGGYYAMGDFVRDETGKLYTALQDQWGEWVWNETAWSLVPEALGNPEAESFFKTERGNRLIASAIERAHAYLAHHSRGIEVILKGSFNDLSNVSLDHTIQLDSPLLRSQKLSGKVKHYRMVLSEEERSVTVTLGVSTGKKEPPVVEKPMLLPWIQEGCLEEECWQPLEECQTPLGKTYLPIEINPQPLRFKRIAQASLEHEAEEQAERLKKDTVVPVTKIHLALPVFSQQAALRSQIEVRLTHAYNPLALWPFEEGVLLNPNSYVVD